MVFYFSATGNSLWVAQYISNAFNEPLCEVSGFIRKHSAEGLRYTLRDEAEMLFFVFPVHSWGPALVMLHFIRELQLSGLKGNCVFAIGTCGDDCGYTDRIVRKELADKCIPLEAFFSLKMPNNYILMRGFGVDPEPVKDEKLALAPSGMEQIVKAVNTRSYSESQILRTGMSWLKSYVVYPVFKKFVIGRQSFRTTDACISCGLCAKVCPTGTIVMQNGRPVWQGRDCVQCTACIHRCPAKAIEFGKVSVGKGRYVHPVLAGK